MTRTCKSCGTTIPDDAPKQRRYCSKPCYAADYYRKRQEGYEPVPPPARPCLNCSAIIPAGSPRQRRFCSTKCSTHRYHKLRYVSRKLPKE